MSNGTSYIESLEDLKKAFEEMSEQERIRLESERDFLKAVRDQSGLAQSSARPFSSIFMVDKIGRFFQEATPSSYL